MRAPAPCEHANMRDRIPGALLLAPGRELALPRCLHAFWMRYELSQSTHAGQVGKGRRVVWQVWRAAGEGMGEAATSHLLVVGSAQTLQSNSCQVLPSLTVCMVTLGLQFWGHAQLGM